MSKRQHDVIGAPAPLRVDGPDGPRDFLVNKPSPVDLATMQKWVLAQPLSEPSQGLTSDEMAGLKPEDRVLLVREYAKVKSTRRAPNEIEVIQLITSAAGVAMQLWLAARRNHPGLSLDDVRKLVTDSNAIQVSVDMDAALEPDDGEPDDPKALAGQA